MNDLAKDFWNIVGKPADPTELDVGDAINLEWGALRQVKVISKKWIDEDGLARIEIRDPLPEDSYDPPSMTVIATKEEG